MWEQIQESEDQGSDKKLWDWLFWEDDPQTLGEETSFMISRNSGRKRRQRGQKIEL